jgi:hypothetical protein
MLTLFILHQPFTFFVWKHLLISHFQKLFTYVSTVCTLLQCVVHYRFSVIDGNCYTCMIWLPLDSYGAPFDF